MSAYLLALLFQPVPAAPPPIVRVAPPAPVIIPPVVTPVAPPPMIVPNYRSEPPVLVQVRVTAGNLVLFNDRLSVDAFQGATFSQSRSESSAATCANSGYDRQQSTYFNLRLSKRIGSGDQRSMTISVTWTRPVEGDPCQGSGTRGATLNQVIPLERGRTAVVTGDGGLKVEITPR